jgi:3'(2'), 5'-bisphosphate nucleotidase
MKFPIAADPQDLLFQVSRIAQKAAEAILVVYESEDFGVEGKADMSPLTKADQAANEIIIAGLKKLAVQFPIISEENKEIPYAERKDFDTFWLVDPLDGTKEFIKRNGEFTVNIALIHHGEVILGVVQVPVTGDLYYAAKGQGAWCQTGNLSRRLSTTKYTNQQPGLRLVCSRSHMNQETTDFVAHYNQPELVSKGSSLKFMLIAAAEAEIYPRLGPTMEWDTAAAQIVVEEAGGRVVRYPENTPLRYNKEVLLNPSFIVYGN